MKIKWYIKKIVLFGSIFATNFFSFAQNTFSCNGNLLLAVHNTPYTLANIYEINPNLNTTPSSVSYSLSNTYTLGFNGVGYNVLDHYIYGSIPGTNNLMKVTTAGTFTYQVQNNPNFAAIGEVDSTGFYLGLSNTTRDTLYRINLNTFPYITSRKKLSMHISGVYDWAISPATGELLGWNNGSVANSGLVKVDTATGVVTQIYNFVGYAFGAIFFNNGNLYTVDNVSAIVYKIDLNNAVAPINTGTVVAGGSMVGGGGIDGCSCPFSLELTQNLTTNDSICAGSPYAYVFNISNHIGANKNNVCFLDTLDSHLSFSQSVSVIKALLTPIYGSSIFVTISNYANGLNNLIKITNMVIPPNISSFTLDINSHGIFPDGYTTIYNQAWLTNLGIVFDHNKKADYLVTTVLEDKTPITFSEVNYGAVSHNSGCANGVFQNAYINLILLNSNYHYDLAVGNSYTNNNSYSSSLQIPQNGNINVFTPFLNNTYTIRVVDYLGCYNDTTLTVINHPSVSVISVNQQTVCSETIGQLIASGATSYTWSNGVIGSIITATMFSTNSYSVIGIDTTSGCSAIGSGTIYVYPTFSIDFSFSPQEIDSYNSLVSFTSTSTNTNIAFWDWEFSDYPNNNSYFQNPVHYFENPGIYPVTLTAQNNFGCKVSITKLIKVNEDFSFYIPNTFTPNGDNLNDIFFPFGVSVKDYKLSIFDRWGEELFRTNNFFVGWNGTYKGDDAKEDTYIWKIEFSINKTLKKTLVGHVNLIR